MQPTDDLTATTATTTTTGAAAPTTTQRPRQIVVEYRLSQVRDLRVVPQARPEGSEKQGGDPKPARPDRPPRPMPSADPLAGTRVAKVAALEVAGEPFVPTSRFWQSLFHRFGLTDNVFRYFRYDEVFARVVEANSDDRLRLCVERPANAPPRLLAVSNPRRPLLGYDETMELMTRYGEAHASPSGDAGEGAKNLPHESLLSYRNGVVRSTHVPRSGEHGFHIGPDQFRNRFVVEAPVDGFGQPRIYLSLLRQVCSNGAVGYSPAFRSDIRMGNDAAYTLERALGQFDHDEGFAALRQRFESAQKSWASIRETMLLHKTLNTLGDGRDGRLRGRKLHEELNRIAGDLNALYGLANLETLSAKRQRVLPARCRVYDLINFASELATHAAGPDGQFRLQGYIGTLISDEYDLEGTAEKVPEFNDLFLNLN
jgi:hypothetical protein